MEVLEIRGDLGALAPEAARVAEVLEAGGVAVFPALGFPLRDEERPLLDPAVFSGRSKNVSLDPATGRLGGTRLQGPDRARLAEMTARYAAFAETLLGEVTPAYGPHLQRRRTSFRPGPVETRVLSARKDDRRLHVDAFPANPVQGRRILRVFTNVNPSGEPRVWNVGEQDFPGLARELAPQFSKPGLVEGARRRLGLTRGVRSPYDAAMLALHDRAKLDLTWQAAAPRRTLSFAAGSSWIVFTDAVLHAALSGQHAFEQTFLLPVEAMNDSARSPLCILEAQAGRALA